MPSSFRKEQQEHMPAGTWPANKNGSLWMMFYNGFSKTQRTRGSLLQENSSAAWGLGGKHCSLERMQLVYTVTANTAKVPTALSTNQSHMMKTGTFHRTSWVAPGFLSSATSHFVPQCCSSARTKPDANWTSSCLRACSHGFLRCAGVNLRPETLLTACVHWEQTGPSTQVSRWLRRQSPASSFWMALATEQHSNLLWKRLPKRCCSSPASVSFNPLPAFYPRYLSRPQVRTDTLPALNTGT